MKKGKFFVEISPSLYNTLLFANRIFNFPFHVGILNPWNNSESCWCTWCGWQS